MTNLRLNVRVAACTFAVYATGVGYGNVRLGAGFRGLAYVAARIREHGFSDAGCALRVCVYVYVYVCMCYWHVSMAFSEHCNRVYACMYAYVYICVTGLRACACVCAHACVACT